MEEKTEPSVYQKDNRRDKKGRFAPGYTPDTAFAPGQSGNPAGRPKNELSLTANLRVKLDEVPGKDDGVNNPRGLTWGELFIERIVKRLVAEGEPRLSQQVLDRLDGPVTQQFAASVEMETTRATMELYRKLLEARPKPKQESDADRAVDGSL